MQLVFCTIQGELATDQRPEKVEIFVAGAVWLQKSLSLPCPAFGNPVLGKAEVAPHDLRYYARFASLVAASDVLVKKQADLKHLICAESFGI